jgi:hypothetical protein
MTDASEKPIAQVAYEAFLAELAKTPDAPEAEHAPPWEAVPEHVRIVIAEAVGAAVRTFAPALVCEVNPEDQSFAQVGYQAYIARTGGLNYQGLPCPVFEALTDTIKSAWAAASTAIRSEHEHRFAAEYDLVVSKEELAELVAGLDLLQRSDAHQAETTFPLRSRLRAALYPAEPERPKLPAPEELPPPSDGAKQELPPDEPGAPAEPTNSEPETPATTPDSCLLVDAAAGDVVPAPMVELPAVSATEPPAPPLPGLEPISEPEKTTEPQG